ncbi:transferase [Actinoplanes capillaceus]|uniref:Transferase n=1 Tax=Actinoplanes campanulatus TaxID=113559 RepID=A0ABQ3WYE5_9ACTN|nr:class I SAM-dependent methyltransferase [Actinoplanes capillaceus]GID51295.1 transferase [Actinoplanes capillaceus]
MPDYDEIYQEGATPWEIGGPQPALAAVVTRGASVLDLGCGTGELAISLARRGHQVTAVDISSVAIERARTKAVAAAVTVDFRVCDVIELAMDPFDIVFDSGLLHSLHRWGGVEGYLALLPTLLVPGGSLFVLAIGVEAGQGWGVTEDYLRSVFTAPDWTNTRVTPADVAAFWNGDHIRLPGYLTSTTRA